MRNRNWQSLSKTPHVELLEVRCMLNAAPVGVADVYQVEQGSVLQAQQPAGLQAFSTDFDDGVLGPELEGDGFAIRMTLRTYLLMRQQLTT